MFAAVAALWVTQTAIAAVPGRVLEPVVVPEELYTEYFSAMADLEDGTYVSINLGVSNAGPGDANGGCRALVVPKDAPEWQSSTMVEREKWKYAAEPEPELTIGPCRATGGKSLAITAQLPGGKVEIALEAPPADMRTHALDAKNGDDFYELEVLVPWAKARVTIARDGQAPRTVNGFGFADHSRATALPGKTAKRWVRFRGIRAAESRLVLVRLLPKGGGQAGFYWAQGAKSRVDITRIALNPTKEGNKKDPSGWRVMLDGEGGPWRITTREMLHRDAPLEEHGFFGSVLGAVVGNPVTYTYRAVLESKVDRREVAGILEIAISDED